MGTASGRRKHRKTRDLGPLPGCVRRLDPYNFPRLVSFPIRLCGKQFIKDRVCRHTNIGFSSWWWAVIFLYFLRGEPALVITIVRFSLPLPPDRVWEIIPSPGTVACGRACPSHVSSVWLGESLPAAHRGSAPLAGSVGEPTARSPPARHSCKYVFGAPAGRTGPLTFPAQPAA